jgi:hypothetical protein
MIINICIFISLLFIGIYITLLTGFFVGYNYEQYPDREIFIDGNLKININTYSGNIIYPIIVLMSSLFLMIYSFIFSIIIFFILIILLFIIKNCVNEYEIDIIKIIGTISFRGSSIMSNLKIK